jgi:hypothetical protein
MVRAKGRASFIVAAVLHGAAVALVLLLPESAPPAPSPETEVSEVDVDVSEPEPARTAEPEPEPATKPSEAAKVIAITRAEMAAKQAPKTNEVKSAPIDDRAAPPEHSDDRVPAPPPKTALRWTTEPDGVDPNALGLGDRNPFMSGALAGNGGEANTADTPPDNKRGQRVIREALHDHDRELGLGSAGPVISAAESIARTSTAAIESEATLDVVADRDGNVTSVSVASASEDYRGWSTVAASLLSALKKQKLHVPPGTNGVAMSIAIVSREQTPSGAAPGGVRISLFDTPISDPTRGKSPKPTIAILPRARIPLPGGKMIVLPIPVPIISGAGDLSDIGAHAQRVVHAHVVSERDL